MRGHAVGYDPLVLHRALNVLAGISLIICLAVCTVWVRSFYRIDSSAFQTARAAYEISSGGGSIAIQRVRPPDGDVRWVRAAVTKSILGVEVIEGRLNRRRPWTLLLLPYSVPAAMAAVLPGVWIARRGRRERLAAQRAREIEGRRREAGVASDASDSARPHTTATIPPNQNPRPLSYRPTA